MAQVRTRRFGTRWARKALALFVFTPLVLELSCGPELSPISTIEGLRIIAVRKSASYAAPGETVDIEMFWEGAQSSQVETFFGFWCVNPPGDLYSECLRGVPTVPPRFVLNEDRFSLRMPDDIVRPPAPGGGNIPYGTAFVFYGVCEGQLQSGGNPLDPGLGGSAGSTGASGSMSLGGSDSVDRNDVPVGSIAGLPRCVDEAGVDVLSDRFVLGYSQIFVYEGYRNLNPELIGFEVDGQSVEAECLNSECVGEVGRQGEELEQCDSKHPCFKVCSNETGEGCEVQRFGAVIDESSAEQDQVALDGFGTDIEENLWVSYFVDRGGVTDPLRLVNDATKGWNPDQTTGIVSPDTPGPITIWAVVRDNRGGASFGRVRAYVTEE
jgi:hypothetical protein